MHTYSSERCSGWGAVRRSPSSAAQEQDEIRAPNNVFPYFLCFRIRARFTVPHNLANNNNNSYCDYYLCIEFRWCRSSLSVLPLPNHTVHSIDVNCRNFDFQLEFEVWFIRFCPSGLRLSMAISLGFSSQIWLKTRKLIRRLDAVGAHFSWTHFNFISFLFFCVFFGRAEFFFFWLCSCHFP